MRIAFDHQTFCLQSHGGISRYFVKIAQQMVVDHQDVAIFAPLHRNAYLKSLPASVVRGVAVGQFPPYSTELIRTISSYAVRLAMRRWGPQVVHETYYSPQRSAPTQCPIIVTVYDMIHELFQDEFSARDHTTQHKRAAIARADHVICISEQTRRDLMDLFGTPSAKISVVHLGVDCFHETASDRDPLPLNRVRPFLLYVGHRGGYKNFSRMVRAVAKSPVLNADFDIVAFGGPAFTTRERQMIASEGLTLDRVRQVGGNDSILAELFSQAAAFVYPSMYEGFGLPPLEAMAHRCPVICSNTSSLPEVVGDAGEFFDPSDPEAIAEAIKDVVYSPERTEDLIRLGAQRIGSFSWEQCARRTLDVYKSVVG